MSQTFSDAPLTSHVERPLGSTRKMWRAAGGFALAHVAFVITGIALQQGPLFQDGTDGIQQKYVEGNLAQTIAGGLFETLGFLLLIPAFVFLARAIGRRTEVGRWAAQTALMAGMGYVAVTMAVGLPAGGAALYGAQHGLGLDTAFAINNIRIFAYFLSLSLLAVHAIGLAIAARQDRIMSRWVGWGGMFTGAVLLASVPAAGIGQQDWGTLVWMVWWIGVAVCLFRHRVVPA